MVKLLAVFAVSLVLAYTSERNTKAILASGARYTVWRDWAYIVLVVMLVLFAGLRTGYNDTGNYISGFDKAPTVFEFFNDPENLNPFKNPLFYFCQSVIKTFFNDAQVLIFSASLFSQLCFIRFLKRYSDNFLFSIFVFFTLGTFVLTLAAIKQVVAMSVLMLAIPSLEQKRWLRYFLLVLLAALVHTYALVFVVLPLFRAKPWRIFTTAVILFVAVVMLNFESAITAFMEQANDLGKTLADYEVFADTTINMLRLAVYAVPPLISLVFQKWVLRDTTQMDNVLIHMSIISLAFMVLGTQAGANMFGRMANYFEMGSICCIPAMLKKTFDTRSYRLVSAVACICFMVFFVYANVMGQDFGAQYRTISVWKFISLLFGA